MQSVKLEKEVVLRLYYFTYQAWRSVHKALGGPWQEFLDFYTPNRRESIQALIGQLRVAGAWQHAYRVGEPIAWQGVWLAGFVAHVPGGHWLSRWRCSFAFTDEQLGYLAFLLDTFLEVLKYPEKPSDRQGQIDLRMALSNCLHLLEKCGASGLIHSGEEIDHFWRTDWLVPVSLEDLLERAGVPRRPSQFRGQQPTLTKN